jgi:hypothetical protein
MANFKRNEAPLAIRKVARENKQITIALLAECNTRLFNHFLPFTFFIVQVE